MTTYVWKSWSGQQCSVEAHRVTFEPGHVAFWRYPEGGGFAADQLVLAVSNANIHDVRPQPEESRQ